MDKKALVERLEDFQSWMTKRFWSVNQRSDGTDVVELLPEPHQHRVIASLGVVSGRTHAEALTDAKGIVFLRNMLPQIIQHLNKEE